MIVAGGIRATMRNQHMPNSVNFFGVLPSLCHFPFPIGFTLFIFEPLHIIFLSPESLPDSLD